MSKSQMVMLSAPVPLSAVLDASERQMSGMGYETTAIMMNETSAILTVKKDRDGIQNLIGLGVECRATLTLSGNAIQVNVDSEWGNKIIAMLVGWFLCLIPFITGAVGCYNQSELPKKICNGIQFAATTVSNQ